MPLHSSLGNRARLHLKKYLTISKKYYEKSLRFAKRVNDVNLEMINQLGIIISNIQNEILEEKQLNIILKNEYLKINKNLIKINKKGEF